MMHHYHSTTTAPQGLTRVCKDDWPWPNGVNMVLKINWLSRVHPQSDRRRVPTKGGRLSPSFYSWTAMKQFFSFNQWRTYGSSSLHRGYIQHPFKAGFIAFRKRWGIDSINAFSISQSVTDRLLTRYIEVDLQLCTLISKRQRKLVCEHYFYNHVIKNCCNSRKAFNQTQFRWRWTSLIPWYPWIRNAMNVTEVSESSRAPHVTP
jgi:hypothetical protein